MNKPYPQSPNFITHKENQEPLFSKMRYPNTGYSLNRLTKRNINIQFKYATHKGKRIALSL